MRGRVCEAARGTWALACLVAATSVGCARENQVWFSPNIGSSDERDLFSRPELWSKARREVSVFKFYAQELLRPDQLRCLECGGNTLPSLVEVQAFSKLRQWGLSIAIEVPAVKPWDCTTEVTGKLSSWAINNVWSHQGIVRYVSMDSPLYGGESCGYTEEEASTRAATFAGMVRRDFPGVSIGDIEQYPHFGVRDLDGWLVALQRHGFKPAFFHLDVDRPDATRRNLDVGRDLRALKDSCSFLGIPFGVIFWGDDGTSDQAYFESVIRWVKTVGAEVGMPENIIFQSWAESPGGQRGVPTNLPEDGPYTHTRLINEGLSILRR